MPRLLSFILFTLSILCCSCGKISPSLSPNPIKIGILHSQTGSYAYTEQAMLEAALLAIKHVNEAGGVLGRPLQAIIYDGASSEYVFESRARELLEKDQVAAIFGCLASNCRKRVKDIVEKHESVLFYPMPYEGIESSPNIIYMGATPNQKVLPVVKWCIDHLGKQFYLIGTETLFSQAMNAIIKANVEALGGTIVGEEIYPINNPPELAAITRDIAKKKPDVIMSNLGRATCEKFLEQLAIVDITTQNTPIFLFGMSAYKIDALDGKLVEGAYGSWCYHESIDSPENKAFIESFKSYYGKGRIVDEPMETAYDAILLWAKAANGLKTLNPKTILREIYRYSIQGPSGPVHISEYNRHAFRRVRIGQLNRKGQVDVCWDSKIALEPDPYPMFKTKQGWEDFLVQYTNSGVPPML